MKSLIVTLDPDTQGGVIAMETAVARAQKELGLQTTLAHLRTGRWDRYALGARERQIGDRDVISMGYIPTIEYLNYLVPSLAIRNRLRRFPVLQLVSGSHAASLIPIVNQRSFVSWVATPYGDEIESRYETSEPSLSVKLNYHLRALNGVLERWTFGFPGKIFALSNYTARRLAELTGLPPDRFAILRMPADVERFSPVGPPWERLRSRYIMSAGRVDDERKNFAALVRCFAMVAPRHPDVSLVIAGAIYPSSTVPRLAAELGIGNRVRFPGRLSGAELAAAYRGADMYVMTSRQEGLGIVVLEALASGRPALIMRCGGSDELVQPGATGWLVDQGDEQGFAAVLDQALSDEPLRQKLGWAAREFTEAKGSSFAAFRGTLKSAYEEVFGGPTA
jgi:glycosyltransferase involved in cell wall biosynthesis